MTSFGVADTKLCTVKKTVVFLLRPHTKHNYGDSKKSVPLHGLGSKGKFAEKDKISSKMGVDNSVVMKCHKNTDPSASLKQVACCMQ